MDSKFLCNPSEHRPLNKIIYVFISLIIVTAWLIKVFNFIKAEPWLAYNSYGVSEFLINFRQGFVRRGLIGDILYFFTLWSGIRPTGPILYICVFSFIVVVFFFLYKFCRNKYLWWLVLSPFLCGMFDTVIRKDYLCYIVIITEIYILRNGVRSTLQCWGVCLLCIIGLMFHEAFMFFGVPISALLILRSKLPLSKYIPLACVFIVFILLCLCKGNPDVASGIVASWNRILPDSPLLDMKANSIGALGWDTAHTFNRHFTINFSYRSFGWLWVVWRAIFFILIYYLIVNFLYVFRGNSNFDSLDRNNISVLYLFSVLCLLPMFTVLSCDCGRVYQYAWMATFVTFLLVPRNTISSLFGSKAISNAQSINQCLDRIVPPRRWLIIVMLLFLAEYPDGPYPMGEFFESPIGTIIRFIGDGNV